MVIVSSDYGELGAAMSFVQGLQAPLADDRTTLLLPPSLLPALADGRHRDLRSYASLRELRAAIVDLEPDTVVFFSAYLLLFAGREIGVRSLRTILSDLRRRSVRLYTSDPFIGLLRWPWSIRLFDFLRTQLPARSRVVVALITALACCRLYLVRQSLAGVVHLYPASIDAARPPPGLRWVQYRGGSSAQPTEQPAEQPAAPTTPAPDRCWMFVLSRVDLDLQQRLQGPGFGTVVERRLRETLRAGRRALLVAPATLIADLQGRFAGVAGVDLRAAPTYADYVEQLIGAEYVFFWNLYSYSILHRAATASPVFFFHAGHMEHVVPALEHAGVACFYRGWRPPLQTDNEVLDAATLGGLAARARPHMLHIAQALQQGQSAAELLGQRATING